jgi:hypothetical protein
MHKINIPKGEYGEFSKIEEEFLELKDAFQQESKILQMIEISDLYGAIEGFCEKNGFDFNEVIRFSNMVRSDRKNVSKERNLDKESLDEKIRDINSFNANCCLKIIKNPDIFTVPFYSVFFENTNLFDIKSLDYINVDDINSMKEKIHPFLHRFLSSHKSGFCFDIINNSNLRMCSSDACMYFDHSFGLKEKHERDAMALVSKLWVTILDVVSYSSEEKSEREAVKAIAEFLTNINISRNVDKLLHEYFQWKHAWHKTITYLKKRSE